MEVIISIVGSLAAKASEYTVDPTARQLSYLFKPRSKFLNLRTKVQELKDATERVQQSVDSANREGEVIFDNVQRWLTVVNEKISDEASTKLHEDEEKATKRCFAGFCPYFKSRYHLSKKADREADAIAKLLIQKDNFDGVSQPSHPKRVDIIRPVKEYEAFGSRRVAFDGVMAALEDDTVIIIGVYGMGGVGKTTLVKEVAGQAREKFSFDEVVFVAVTQTPNTVRIQNEIANQLGLPLDKDQSEHVRAARILDRLKKAKKILVILDDLWKEQEVDTLGIPSADQHQGCKMLMTSRSLDVLKRMDSRANISIEILTEVEAWNLFKKMAGQIVEKSDLKSTAVEVAKRCAGLPIAITTMAKALKPKENLFEWRDALRQLSTPSERNFKDIPADAYSAIELSYKFLEGEELGPIFLLCSIMGHNAAVEDLLRYAIGLGFIHDVHTVEESRDRVLTLINNLKVSCLFVEGSHPNCFGMHDVVRDVAQSIASRDLHWLALFKEWPDEEKMKKSQLISLQDVEVSEILNHDLECPNLNYFSIGLKDSSSLKISNNFFNGMKRLKVLEFAETHFTSLPFSIGSSKTLSTLRLMHCGLKDIVIIGELENLEILDLRRSIIEMLPKEIEKLTKLKLLDLSDCYNLKVISPNVLSKLSKFEELYLCGGFVGWEVEEIENPRRNASLVELQHLSRLTTLEVHIPDVKAIPKDNLFFGKMKRYKISIGGDDGHWYHMETSRTLILRMNKSFHLIDGIKLLLRKTQSLYLYGSKHAIWLFDKKFSCPALEKLYLDSVSGIEKIWRIDDHLPLMSFGVQNLTILDVKGCNKLKCVFTSSMVKCFVHLKNLTVSYCDEMEGKIEGILASTEEGIGSNISLFPKLVSLELNFLPKLNRFCCEINPIEFPSLRYLWIGGCPDLKTFAFDNGKSRVTTPHYLFNEKVIFPVLEDLKIQHMDNLERLWPNQLAQHSSSKLTSIDLVECPKLLHVFPLSMLTRLDRLNSLSIYDCKSLEEIIFESRSESQRGSSSAMPSLSSQIIQSDVVTFEFPNLTSLELFDLPNLRSIHHKMHALNWPSLKEMKVSGCDKVEVLFASQETSGNTTPQPLFWVNESTFPNLHQLTLKCNNGIKVMIFQSEEGGEEQHASLLLSQITKLSLKSLRELMHLWNGKEGFQNLKILYVNDCSPSGVNLVPSSVSFRNLVTLDVHNCDGIIKLISHSTAKSLAQLKEMSILFCKNMEEIIQGGDGDDEISFPKLNRLCLDSLPTLESFCSSENYTFGFPSLESLRICHCPKMEIFSHGDPETPLLHEVRLDYWGYEKYWEGSLNSTIRHIFREKIITNDDHWRHWR